MKPYLEPNETIAFLIEWGGLVLFLALVLLPFLLLLRKKVRPITWWNVAYAYIASFGIFGVVELLIIAKIHDNWLLPNFVNTGWVSQALTGMELKMTLLLFALWPLSVFYITKLKYRSFTKLRFFVSLAIAIALFALMAFLMAWAIAFALGALRMDLN